MKLVLDCKNRNVSGSRIREARLDKNMTQQELSQKLEIYAIYINRASISKIEQHKRIVMDFELVALSKVLNISVNWLLNLNEED